MFDPLDGSSKIDMNVSVGSIFSMCRLGADLTPAAARPRFIRSLSITSSAAMSRILAFKGASPTRSPAAEAFRYFIIEEAENHLRAHDEPLLNGLQRRLESD